MTGTLESSRTPPTVLIVGAGWIGSQIGLRMASYGVAVQLFDKDSAVSNRALEWMDRNAEDYRPVTRDQPGRAEWSSLVSIAESLDACSSSIDLILECVPEQISLKRRVLKELGDRFAPPTIIASNSSYFIPSLLARFVAHDWRFGHLHFHAPLYRSTIADIAGGPNTQPEVIQRLCTLAKTIGQEPLVLRREHPGYVFNWLLQSLLRSALELAAKGVAQPEDIDRAWKTVAGMSAGPFEIMDEIGLDLVYQGFCNARWSDLKDVPIEQLLEVLKQSIEARRLGVKTGQGFYDHRNSAPP